MGRLRPPAPVKLYVGLLSGDPDVLRRARQLLAREFGPTDAESDVWPFHFTDYYRDEMGPHLLRQMLSFERLVRCDDLPDAKRRCNALEERIAEECLSPEVARPVNIDPGYLDLGKFVLATTKDRSHRIHVGGAIFAEVTLEFTGGAWRTLPWTYPDYASAPYQAFLSAMRDRLRTQRSSAPTAPSHELEREAQP